VSTYALPEFGAILNPAEVRRRALIAVSDRLLGRLEALNLATYAPTDRYPRTKVVLIEPEVARAVDDLRLEVGLPARRLRDTTAALQAVYEAQEELFCPPVERLLGDLVDDDQPPR
jgi:hypothetical protein